MSTFSIHLPEHFGETRTYSNRYFVDWWLDFSARKTYCHGNRKLYKRRCCFYCCSFRELLWQFLLQCIEQDRMSPCVKEIFWNYTRAKVRFSDDPHILQSNLEKVCETILELKNKDNSIDNHSFLVDQDKFTRFANMLLSYKHFIIPNSYLIICCMVCILLAGIFIILWV